MPLHQDSGHADVAAFPVVLALTREMAEMDVEQLTDLFRKVRIAVEQSYAS
jgi:hypothetical protein